MRVPGGTLGYLGVLRGAWGYYGILYLALILYLVVGVKIILQVVIFFMCLLGNLQKKMEQIFKINSVVALH